MSKYKVLPAHLHDIAGAAENILKTRFNLSNAIVEGPINDKIGWSPTLHWKTKTGYIACEVHETPCPVIIRSAFSDISTLGLPVRIFIAHPTNHHLPQSEFHRESGEARRYGCGLLSIDEAFKGTFQYLGIEIPLYLHSPKFSSFSKAIQAHVQQAFTLYMDGDPRHGVQEIGQTIENIITNLAHQAKKKGTLLSGGFPPSKGKHYAQGKLIEDLMRDTVIDNAILGKCRGFVEDRNATSHKPKNIKEAIELNRKLKNAMSDGLFILEELPKRIKEKGFHVKVT